MNKNKFTEFFKGKGYYVLLFVGVMAIAAVAIIGSQLASNENQQEQNYVDLNDTDDNIATGEGDTELAENDPVIEGIVNNGDSSSDETAANEDPGEEVTGDQVEYEGYDVDTTAAGDDQTEFAEAPEQEDETAQVEEDNASSVETDTQAVLDNLSFKVDDGLLWPVNGNVLMNYSMDHTVYFATLMQYKVNPAIIIDAEVGTDVMAAADGMVTDIVENEETGFTITMNIGDGYSLVYGQLDKESVSLEVGDTVNEGDVIGTVAEPSKYYSVEGSNLYFQVMADEETVNPMLLLR